MLGMRPTPTRASLRHGVRVWLATGRTNMRKGMDGLALQVQEVVKHDP
jgi:transposase